MSKDGFQFRTEIQIIAVPMKIQWLDSQTVAREDESVTILRPNRQSEHAAQARKAILVPSQKRTQNDFGVAAGSEFFAAGLQLCTQLSVVIDLAVEYEHGVAVIADHGLIAPVQIDDFEAHGP